MDQEDLIDKEFGKYLKKLRKDRNITLDDLEKSTKIKKYRIIELEDGECWKSVTKQECHVLAIALAIDPYQLMFRAIALGN